jgi:hypothetical protein
MNKTSYVVFKSLQKHKNCFIRILLAKHVRPVVVILAVFLCLISNKSTIKIPHEHYVNKI